MQPVVSVGACSIGRCLVATLYDIVRLGKALLNVPKAHPAALVSFVDKVVGAPMGDNGRVRLERLFDVEHGRQFFQVELDFGDSLLGGLLGFGHDGRDLLALVAHPIRGQHRLIVGLDPDQAEDGIDVLGNILVGEGPHKARHLFRFGKVDALDLGVVHRAANHLEMEHVGELSVVHIDGLAGHVAQAIATRNGLANDIQGFVCHDLNLLCCRPVVGPRPRWPWTIGS